jgi:hypothetical protein
MKKLFSLIISFVLITSPLTYGQTTTSSSNSNSTAATPAPSTLKTDKEQELYIENKIKESGGDSAQVKKIKSESQSAPDAGKNAEYDKNSQSSGGYDFYAKQILAISTSIIGSSIISQCSFGVKIPSIATFMAGSIVHIASEIMGAKAQNENHKKKMEDLKNAKDKLGNKQGGEVQRDAILKRKQEEEQTRDYLASRATWMTAVTVIYYLAMGLAIYEEIQGHAAGKIAAATTCLPVAEAVAAPCLAGAGATYAFCVPPLNVACLAFSPTGALAAEAAFATPASPVAVGMPACAASTIWIAGCEAYLTYYSALAYANCLPLSIGSGLLSKAMVVAITAAYSMGVTNDTAAMTKYITMFSSLLLFFSTFLQSMVMAAYNFPIPRSITFGVSAILATMITMGLNQRKAIAEENIKDLEKLLAEFDKNTKNGNAIGEGGLAKNAPKDEQDREKDKDLEIQTPKRLQTINALGKAGVRRSCVSTADGKFEVSESACVKPLKLTKPNFDFKSGEKTLNEVSLMANDFANAVSSGDTDRANLLAGKISAQAARVKDIVNNLQDRVNDDLKKQKKKPINFNKEMKDKLASYQNTLNKEAKSRGFPALSLSESALGADLNSIAKEVSKDLSKTGATATVTSPDASTLSEGEQSANEVTELSENAADEKSLAERLEEFEENNSEISKDSGRSIFEQVSNRYIHSLPRLLKRRETLVPVEKK